PAGTLVVRRAALSGWSPDQPARFESLRSHASAWTTMVCRSLKRGCHPSTERTRSQAATICVRSSARRGASSILKSTPATRLTVSITSSTEKPRIVLAHRHALGAAVDRRDRGEDEMARPGFDRGVDQGAGVDRVVAVVAERIADRVWHDDRGGEMDNGVDPMRGDERAYARLVSGIAGDERRARRHRPVEARGQIIEHHDLVSGLEEGVNHVAADVAGAAGNQDRHVVSPSE